MGKIQKWLFDVAVKKGLKRAVAAAIALLPLTQLEQAGITVDVSALEVTVLSLAVGVVEFVRNFLKHKLGWGL